MPAGKSKMTKASLPNCLRLDFPAAFFWFTTSPLVPHAPSLSAARRRAARLAVGAIVELEPIIERVPRQDACRNIVRGLVVILRIHRREVHVQDFVARI